MASNSAHGWRLSLPLRSLQRAASEPPCDDAHLFPLSFPVQMIAQRGRRKGEAEGCFRPSDLLNFPRGIPCTKQGAMDESGHSAQEIGPSAHEMGGYGRASFSRNLQATRSPGETQ